MVVITYMVYSGDFLEWLVVFLAQCYSGSPFNLVFQIISSMERLGSKRRRLFFWLDVALAMAMI